jgi:hypothetical protein
MSNTPSPVLALLALPSIGRAGVERSIVFAHLPPHVQDEIRRTPCEADKRAVAQAAGDDLIVIAQMYEHYVAAPIRREQARMGFPAIATLDDFPLPGVLREEDRAWLCPGESIADIACVPQGVGFAVRLYYADGTVMFAQHDQRTMLTLEQARDLHHHVCRAAYILGIYAQAPRFSRQ